MSDRRIRTRVAPGASVDTDVPLRRPESLLRPLLVTKLTTLLDSRVAAACAAPPCHVRCSSTRSTATGVAGVGSRRAGLAQAGPRPAGAGGAPHCTQAVTCVTTRGQHR